LVEASSKKIKRLDLSSFTVLFASLFASIPFLHFPGTWCLSHPESREFLKKSLTPVRLFFSICRPAEYSLLLHFYFDIYARWQAKVGQIGNRLRGRLDYIKHPLMYPYLILVAGILMHKSRTVHGILFPWKRKITFAHRSFGSIDYRLRLVNDLWSAFILILIRCLDSSFCYYRLRAFLCFACQKLLRPEGIGVRVLARISVLVFNL
jgi:hypothetical protein